MSTFVGSKDTKAVKVGTKDVSAVYVGAQQIWPDGPGMLPPELTMDLQIIGGGGGGSQTNANSYARGGGAGGGFKQVMNIPIEPGKEYSVRVGAGGTNTVGGSKSGVTNYNLSMYHEVLGGGPSGQPPDNSGDLMYQDYGGSGGGGKAKASKGYAGATSGPFGNNGGDGAAFTSGAGGGAGAKPNASQQDAPARGGAGLQCWDLKSRAGGGGAAGPTKQSKGMNGGGNGAIPGGTPTNGQVNTGGGGGGGCPNESLGTPRTTGGSGIVLIRTTWPNIESDTGTMTTLESGHYLWTFTHTGTLTVLP